MAIFTSVRSLRIFYLCHYFEPWVWRLNRNWDGGGGVEKVPSFFSGAASRTAESLSTFWLCLVTGSSWLVVIYCLLNSRSVVPLARFESFPTFLKLINSWIIQKWHCGKRNYCFISKMNVQKWCQSTVSFLNCLLLWNFQAAYDYKSLTRSE